LNSWHISSLFAWNNVRWELKIHVSYSSCCDFLIFADICGLFCECRYGKFAYRGACKQNKFWLAILLNVNQSKQVGGRRSLEELYQVLFFVSPFPPECFTERNENRAWSQVKDIIADSQNSLLTRKGKYAPQPYRGSGQRSPWRS